MPDDDATTGAPAAPSGEPAAGTEPGRTPGVDGPADEGTTDTDADSVLVDPGSAGDSADVAESGPTAVVPADPAAGGGAHG